MENITDRDGDLWEYEGGGRYRCVTHRSGGTATRDEIRRVHGIKEEPTAPRVFKPVTIPDDVTRVVNVIGMEFVRNVDGGWNSTGGNTLDEAELLNLNPSGLTEVVESDYDLAVAYFKDYRSHTDPSWLPNSETKRHLAALINNLQESK